jgi:parvulin-like peptidyl-prolyl isomerase
MRFFSFSAVLLAGTIVSAQTPAPQPKPAAPGIKSPAAAETPADKVVLAVGDEKMTAAQFQEFISALPEQYRAAAQGAGKRQVADQLVNLKTLAQEAKRRKMDQTPAFKAQLAFQTENLLAGVLFRDLSSTMKISEADSRKYYDAHKSEYERVQARHILIRFKGSPVPTGDKKDLTEEEALAKTTALRARIEKGEDFAAVAKAESDDTGSGANGGDLGMFGHGQMVPVFDQTAFSQPIGQVSQPVKSQFGYHLIKTEKKESKSFEEMRADIDKQLMPELAQKTIEDLKTKTPVTIDEGFFGPAEAKPAQGAPAPAADAK